MIQQTLTTVAFEHFIKPEVTMQYLHLKIPEAKSFFKNFYGELPSNVDNL